jgi:hypothetical protein
MIKYGTAFYLRAMPAFPGRDNSDMAHFAFNELASSI